MRLDKDLREAAKCIGQDEARFLVDAYYQMQHYRIATGNQLAAQERGDNPPRTILAWLHGQEDELERAIRNLLGKYGGAHPVGRWAMEIMGIGPVIAAGLLAHIDIRKAKTVGAIWRFAGLDPTTEWAKGEKRPWNADLKTLCWKIGESFVRVSGRDGDIYGQVYQQRKAYEQERNAAGEYGDQAAAKAKAQPKHAQIKSYREGKLPDGHIHMRAKRYAVKLFLAHWHHVAYEVQFGEPPPKPYVIQHLGHAGYQGPPNWPMGTGPL